MKYTLMAIAIKESSVGKQLINNVSKDYGLFQANIKSVIRRQKVQDNIYNRNYFAKKLVYDAGFSTANAIVLVLGIEMFRFVYFIIGFLVFSDCSNA